MKTLRPYQEKTLAVLATDSSGLVGSGLGSGKTLVGTERIRQLKNRPPRVLIVAPINTHRQWVATIEEQYPSIKEGTGLYVVSTPRATPETWDLMTAKKAGVFIIGWEAMRGDLPKEIRQQNTATTKAQPPVTVAAIKAAIKAGLIPPWTRTGTWSLVILDESHRISNKNSLTKKVLSQIKTEKKLAMSGTAAGNKPEGLWSTLNWLWPSQYGSFWRWARTFLEIEERPIGRNPNDTVEIIVGEIDPGATWSAIPCAVRYRTRDITDQLPEVIERIVPVPMSDAQQRVYEEFENDALAWVLDQTGGEQGADYRAIVSAYPIGKRIRLRTAALGDVMFKGEDDEGKPIISFNPYAKQAKVQAIKEIITDLPEDEPVLIFTHSSKWADMAAADLQDSYAVKGEVRSWTGALTPKQRDDLKQAFGKNIRVMIAVIPAVAEGIDGWQNVCRCEIWASETENGLINQQAKGRLHRPGQTSPVQRWLLQSENTIDADVHERLLFRIEQMRQFYRDDKKG